MSLFSASNSYLEESLNGRCDQSRLISDLRDLLSLYFQPNELPEQRARIVAIFVKDLADMSDDCVGHALETWRRTEDRRPSPASLRQLCMMRRQEATKAMGTYRPAGVVQQPIGPGAERPETVSERQAIIGRASKSCGMVQHNGNWTTPERVAEDEQEKRLPHWSETMPPDSPWYAALKRARAANALMDVSDEDRARHVVINSAPEPF